MRQNLNNLIFAAIVLFSVLLGGVPKETPQETTFEYKPEITSLLANLKTASPDIEFAATFTQPPGISAAALLVKDLFVAEPMLAINTSQQWPMASLSKLMTAIISLDNIAKGSQIKISERAIATESTAGNLVSGGVYTPEYLLGMLLKVSSNDAAAGLAEYLGENQFLQLMNQKAAELNMNQTRFFDPSGLSPLNQSTVEDLEKLVMHIYYRHPEIFRITQGGEGNIHPFASRPDFIGGKTGFIDEANGNLISLFNNDGRPLLVIVLGSDDRAKDTQLLHDRFTSR